MKYPVFPFLSAMFAVLVAFGIARLISALASLAKIREPTDIYAAWALFLTWVISFGFQHSG